MALPARKPAAFLASEEGIAAAQALRALMDDTHFHTASSFSANSDTYPDGQQPFDEKHLAYLSLHPKTDPTQYISNLRLKIRKR